MLWRTLFANILLLKVSEGSSIRTLVVSRNSVG